MKIIHFISILENEKAGLFNSVFNRIKEMKKYEDEFEVYNIVKEDSKFIEFLKNSKGDKVKAKVDSFKYDEIKVKNVYVKTNLFNYLSNYTNFNFNLLKNKNINAMKYLVDVTRKADLIMAQGAYPDGAGVMANKISKVNKIPYCLTLHGTDIHTAPMNSINIKREILKLLFEAKHNFFVSNDLVKEARSLGYTKKNFSISYNGYETKIFNKINLVKNKSNIIKIGFVGNLNYIKRSDQLIKIFTLISKQATCKIKYYVIGDGKFEKKLKAEAITSQLDIKFFGRINKEKTASKMKELNFLLLPSRNEGLPLVILEALACGVTPIAAEVGGIKEVLGEEFLVENCSDFNLKFAEKVNYINNSKLKPKINLNDFVWDKIIEKDYKILKRLFNDIY